MRPKRTSSSGASIAKAGNRRFERVADARWFGFGDAQNNNDLVKKYIYLTDTCKNLYFL